MPIKIIDKKISESELREIAKDFYIDMIKGVVDIERGILAIGGEYHMDANIILIESGSKQQNIWGFNWYFDRIGDERIDYVSLINIRPAQGNKETGSGAFLQEPLQSEVRPPIVIYPLLANFL